MMGGVNRRRTVMASMDPSGEDPECDAIGQVLRFLSINGGSSIQVATMCEILEFKSWLVVVLLLIYLALSQFREFTILFISSRRSV